MSAVAGIPAEFVQEYERERGRVLRRRALWYCLVVFIILSISMGGTAADLAQSVDGLEVRDLWIEFSGDVTVVAIHLAGAFLLWWGDPSRTRVVSIVSWLIALTGAVVMFYTPLVDNSAVIEGATTGGGDEAVMLQGVVTLLAVFLLHFIASMLVTLSPREGLRPLVPLLVLFAVLTLLRTSTSLGVRLALIALSPLAGLPGLLFSWWRHRSFSERFQARAIARRYGEVSRDLADAQRVHEALFPTPITSGPVRLAYAYEPARHIGGDYLFVHAQPDEARGALTAVVVDVTGHGVPAALAVNRLHMELTRLFQDLDPDPADVIGALNAFALTSLAAQRIYASALCVRITPGARPGEAAVVEWSSAGHPQAIIRRATGAIALLQPTTCLLGVLTPDDFDPHQQAERLEGGDVLIAVTDGAIEAADRDGRHFGMEGLLGLIAPLAPPLAISPALISGLATWRGGTPATDDTLIVEIRLG